MVGWAAGRKVHGSNPGSARVSTTRELVDSKSLGGGLHEMRVFAGPG